MIGKVQDVMAGAIVIGAADKAASSTSKAASAQPQPQSVSAATEIERMQDEWNANGGIAPVDSADQQKANGEESTLDEKSVSLITDELNELMEKINCDIAFKYHKEVNMMSVSMINKKTEEVIKELPPEEMIDNIKKAREWIGAFLDKNA